MASQRGGPASRLQIREGRLALAYPTFHPITGALLELNEQSCRGVLSFHGLAVEAVNEWKKLLIPKRPIHIRLDVPPYLQDLEIDGTISVANACTEGVDVDVQFHQMTTSNRNVLAQAILTLATERVRYAAAHRAAEAPPSPPLPPSPGRHAAPVPHPAPAMIPAPSSVGLGANGSADELPAILPAAPALPHDSAVLKNPQLMRAAMTMPTDPGGAEPKTTETRNLKTKRLGEVLVHMGRLSPDQVMSAVNNARNSGERLGRYLLRTAQVQPDALCRALALQTGLPMTDLTDAEIPDGLVRIFPHEMMMQYSFVPFDDSKSFVCVAVADPLPQNALKELEKLCGKRIEIFLAQEDLLVRTLDKIRGRAKRKLRRHIRYEINTLVRYQFCSRLGNPAEEVIHNGTTLNISEGGFLIEGSPTALGSPDDLRRRGMCARVVLTGTFQEIAALCHLRSIRARERQEAGKARWLLGLEIAEIAADDRRRLKELCMRAMAEKVKESE